MKNIDPKLLKIVALAKYGVGGEKKNADRLVRQLCRRLEIDYSEVMDDESDKYTEYTLPMRYRTNAELRVLSQVCFRFANTGDSRFNVAYNKWRKAIFVTTTSAKFVEASQAAAVYLAAFRRERRRVLQDLPLAFISRNSLYSDHTDESVERPAPTLEQRQRSYRVAHLGEMMDSVKLHKAIEG